MTLTTQEASQRKLADLNALVSDAEALLGPAPAGDKAISAAKTADIVANIKARKEGWSSEAVTAAFIRAACAAHRKTNCLTEALFTEALEAARAVDKELATGVDASKSGPFYGSPSSFKDTYNILGVDTSLGCSPYCFEPTTDPEEEANLVKLFRAGGGIPFCKTGVPQTLLAFECSNPVFGTTTNPYDSSRTCGGSSGGEAALVTSRGTPVGWGSDIGGSLRIPASYSGCCGSKPTVGRWASSGNRPVVRGQESISPTTGPMASNVDDSIYASKAMMDSTTRASEDGKMAAEGLLPIPWREKTSPKRMKIGYYRETGMVRTSPALLRASDITIAKLRAEGHEVVEWDPPASWKVFEVFAASTSADGYRQSLANIGPDPKEPSLALVTAGSSVPRWSLSLATGLVKNVLGDETFAHVMATSHAKSASELFEWVAQRNKSNKEFKTKAWEQQGFDFVSGPPQAVPALEHGRTKMLSPSCIGTCVWNVLDTTAGVIPVTRVRKDLDAVPEGWSEIGEGEARSSILEKRVYGGSDPAYDAGKMEGSPVGVQIVGRQWDEEGVSAAMKSVEGLVDYQ